MGHLGQVLKEAYGVLVMSIVNPVHWKRYLLRDLNLEEGTGQWREAHDPYWWYRLPLCQLISVSDP